jgi:hypothetical protein
MKASLQICLCIVTLAIALLSAWRSSAFALLGPFEPWMQETNGFRQPGDIGGPMCLTNGYRWNVPVVTYGFDPSFVAFFGTNGEAAVEGAIQTINNLPSASDIALTNYPFNGTLSFDAQALNLLDLKSWTLSLLLEQLGLAQPTRYVFVIRQWSPTFSSLNPTNDPNFPGSLYPDYISERNFDPQTLEISPYVNGTLYSGEIYTVGGQNFLMPFPVDQDAVTYTAVADQSLNPGDYYSGLTYDDMGGLRYLYSTNNINYEYLLPGVSYAGKKGELVNDAWRPGVNKITFVPQLVSRKSGTFQPMSILYTDTYISNGVWFQQPLRRIVSRPDFLFSAGDVTASAPSVPSFSTTSTADWINYAAVNGNTNGAGPGIIQPPIQIVFNKLGASFYSYDYVVNPYVSSLTWASYGNTTNPPVNYPVPQTGTNQLTFRMWLIYGTEFQKSFTWKPTSLIGTQYALQSSTDLKNWTTLFIVTNNNTVCTYFNYVSLSGSQFYRLVPQ